MRHPLTANGSSEPHAKPVRQVTAKGASAPLVVPGDKNGLKLVEAPLPSSSGGEQKPAVASSQAEVGPKQAAPLAPMSLR